MENKPSSSNYYKFIALAIVGVVFISLFFDLKISVGQKSFFYKFFGPKEPISAATVKSQSDKNNQDLVAEVLPQSGVEIPATWGDLGKQLISSGVIDENSFRAVYAQRGGLTTDEEKMFSGEGNGKIRITQSNANFVLNMLWALGLGNKNDILDNGEMTNKQYGGAGNFASTGGWTLAKGTAMSHYSKHKLITLNADQQTLVDSVSKNIYRPCCGNSTHFPDCNHGMAMLGLMELMASQGASDQEMYKTALAVNSYWFPNNYLTIASYFKTVNGIDWANVDPKTALAAQYSSNQGYAQLLDKVNPQQAPRGGGGCGV